MSQRGKLDAGVRAGANYGSSGRNFHTTGGHPVHDADVAAFCAPGVDRTTGQIAGASSAKSHGEELRGRGPEGAHGSPDFGASGLEGFQ